MSNVADNEKVIDNGVDNEIPAFEENEVKDGLGKKVLKIGLKVLACVATGIAGFFIGRASKGDDDDDDTNSNDTETETVE